MDDEAKDKIEDLENEILQIANQRLIIGEYKSFYCIINRRYNFNNIDFTSEKDKAETLSYIKQRLSKWENELLIGNYRNYLERYELIGRIRELKSLIYKLEEGKSESF